MEAAPPISGLNEINHAIYHHPRIYTAKMKTYTAKILLLLILTMSCAMKPYPKTDHFDGEKFTNPWNTFPLKNFWDVIKWRVGGTRGKWPDSVENKPYALPQPQDEKAIVTYINHATFLIQIKGLNILTDPVLSERVSPVSFAGPKRVRPPGLPLEKLPKIDLILVSHNHYDHLDLPTLNVLLKRDKPRIIVPLGDEAWLAKKNIKAEAMDWWQEIKHKDITVTFAPATHWSGRSLTDKNECLWGSFFVKSDEVKIYFAGDTGMGPHFDMIKIRLGPPDLALLPIGAYEPRWFMQPFHLNPKEAVEARKILGATQAIGMHFGIFQLSDEDFDQPVRDLKTAMIENKLKDEDFLVLDVGQSQKIKSATSTSGTGL